MGASGRADEAAANGADADAGAGRNDGQMSNYPIGSSTRNPALWRGAIRFRYTPVPFRFTGGAAAGPRGGPRRAAGRRPDDR